MSPEKLTYMANQIGKFFAHEGGDAAVAGIADHIAKFWDPRMRADIFKHVRAGGHGLDAPVLKAVTSLMDAAKA